MQLSCFTKILTANGLIIVPDASRVPWVHPEIPPTDPLNQGHPTGLVQIEAAVAALSVGDLSRHRMIGRSSFEQAVH